MTRLGPSMSSVPGARATVAAASVIDPPATPPSSFPQGYLRPITQACPQDVGFGTLRPDNVLADGNVAAAKVAARDTVEGTVLPAAPTVEATLSSHATPTSRHVEREPHALHGSGHPPHSVERFFEGAHDCERRGGRRDDDHRGGHEHGGAAKTPPVLRAGSLLSEKRRGPAGAVAHALDDILPVPAQRLVSRHEPFEHGREFRGILDVAHAPTSFSDSRRAACAECKVADTVPTSIPSADAISRYSRSAK